MKEFIINNKTVRIYNTDNLKEKSPVIILNCFSNETQNIFDECLKLDCQSFILVTISNLDWNNEMTPYFAPKTFKNGSDYLGKADDYIKILENDIIPKIEEYIKNNLKTQIDYFAIVGYSLAGLFAIYSTYKTNLFSRVASVSGSLWYPDFIDFIKSNPINPNIKKVYFSLGDRESKTKNQFMKPVEDNTKFIENYYKNSVKTIFEFNQGNHFENCDYRCAKSIKWVLE